MFRSLILLVPFLAPILGLAQDFYWSGISTRAQGLAGIAVPTQGSALDALGANPALLSSFTRPTVDLSLTGAFLSGTFTNSANSNSPIQTAPGAIPAAAIAIPILPGKLTVAAGLTPELLSLSQWTLNDAPGTAGASYGTRRHLSRIVALRTGFAIAWRPTARLALGYSAGLVDNTNRLNAPYIFQTQPALAGLKVNLDLKTSGRAWNSSFGFWANPTRRFAVGLAWKSQTSIRSTGSAIGDASAQFAALGVNAPGAFSYNARVDNTLPASLLLTTTLNGPRRWLFALEAQSIRWQSAFRNLPVTLTGGSNAVINAVAGSSTLLDSVPLHWRNQYLFRAAAERTLGEHCTARAGFGWASNAVPSSTLTPLTAAIFQQHYSSGLSYLRGRIRLDLAYSLAPKTSQSVGQSLLRSGEYSNSTTWLRAQTLSLGLNFHL